MSSGDHRHRNSHAILVRDDGTAQLGEMEAHAEGECDQAAERTFQRMLGHETVYEAPDAHSARSTVGYSKSYAENFDAAFGKN